MMTFIPSKYRLKERYYDKKFIWNSISLQNLMIKRSRMLSKILMTLLKLNIKNKVINIYNALLNS